MTVREAEAYIDQYEAGEYPGVPAGNCGSVCYVVPPEILYLPELDLYFSPAYEGVFLPGADLFLPGEESCVAFFPGGDGEHPVHLARESIVCALAEYLYGCLTEENYRKAAALNCETADCAILGYWD